MSEPSPQELSAQLIVWARDRGTSGPGEHPVSRWEHWIAQDPELGWAVLRELVERAPNDVEVMFQAAYRVPQLLHRDFQGYRERVLALLETSSYLDALLGPEVFIEADYAPRTFEPEHLAQVWLRNSREADRMEWPERLDREDPEVRLRIALEIIERGPLHGLDSDDVDGLLCDVLRQFGGRAIAQIELAARRSAGVRLAIWSARHRQRGHLVPQVPDELWARFQAAAGDTNACNTRLPAGEVHRLAPPEEELVEAWLAHQGTFWAWCELADRVNDEPERAWATILAIVRGSETSAERNYCGAYPLEDLIRTHPAQFIERAEALAGRDEKFREALAGSWIALEDVPELLARRYFRASGGKLRVLDAPAGWNQDDPGGQA